MEVAALPALEVAGVEVALLLLLVVVLVEERIEKGQVHSRPPPVRLDVLGKQLGVREVP